MPQRTLVFDIETDGLLDTITKLHCISAVDVATDEEFFFPPSQIEEGLAFLEKAERLIAHNGLDFDCPAIEKLYPKWRRPPLWDTLIFCKMVWPSDLLVDRDMARARQGRLPGNLIKRQSIEAWGYRLGVMKVGADITDWSTYTDYMGERNRSDVRVNLALWKLICKRIGWGAEEPEDGFVWSEECFELEHQVAVILQTQERTGFKFNKKAAIKLAQVLTNLQAEHTEKLKEVFGGWWAPLPGVDPHVGQRPMRAYSQTMGWLPEVTIPRVSAKTGKALKPYVGPPKMEFSPDAPYTPIEWVEFNPSSRLHLGQRLMKLYGWKPEKFGGKDNRQPVVDEGTIADLPPHILPEDIKKHILDYFVVTKTLGQLSVGRQSWLAACKENGRIHGRVDQLGAITARGTHRNPNLAQVPSVVVKEHKDDAGKIIKKEIVEGLEGGFGFECRSLFEGEEELTGTDAAGLELRSLGHHLTDYDGGEFARRVSDPSLDIHEENSKITGLKRSSTKTVTYACVPLDTKVLTRKGWKLYNELCVGEDILTYNQEKQIKEWAPLEEVVYYEDAPLVRLHNRQWFDVRCTPNHRWYVRRRSRTKAKPYMVDEVVAAEDINTEHNIIINAPFGDEESHPKPGCISLSEDDKYDHTDWSTKVLAMDHSQRKSFLAGFLLADGHYRRQAKAWSWSQNTGVISEALLLASYLVSRGAISVTHRTNPLNQRDMTLVRMSRKGHITSQKVVREDAGRAPVFCVRTRNGSFVMRQGDVITVTGNTLYGAGPWTVGVGVGYSEEEEETLLSSPSLRNYLRFLKGRLKEMYQEPSKQDQCYIAKGLEVIRKFEAGIVGIKDLKKDLAASAERGWLRGLDGRKVYVRKAHASLNTKLQSDGAIICKKWMVELWKRLKHLLLSYRIERGEDRNAQQVVWVHDELQIEHSKGLGALIAATSQSAMKAAEKAYEYRCPLATSASTGRTWADTH